MNNFTSDKTYMSNDKDIDYYICKIKKNQQLQTKK